MFLMLYDVNSSAQLLTKIMFEPLEIDKNFRHADVRFARVYSHRGMNRYGPMQSLCLL